MHKQFSEILILKHVCQPDQNTDHMHMSMKHNYMCINYKQYLFIHLLLFIRSILWCISVVVAVYTRSSHLRLHCLAHSPFGTNQVSWPLKPWWNRPFPTLSKWLAFLLPVPPQWRLASRFTSLFRWP